MTMGDFENWCDLESGNGRMTNKEFVDVFVNKYLKWLYSKRTRSGRETRVLRLDGVNQTQLRRDILLIVYNMS